MIFQCIDIRQVPWEVLKTAAFSLGFQHLPRDLANVNAWKTMFDPYNKDPFYVFYHLFCRMIRNHKILSSLQMAVIYQEFYLWVSWFLVLSWNFLYNGGFAGLGGSVGCLTPAGSWDILWGVIMECILQSFSPFCWFKKGNCQFLTKECAQVLVNRLEDTGNLSDQYDLNSVALAVKLQPNNRRFNLYHSLG